MDAARVVRVAVVRHEPQAASALVARVRGALRRLGIEGVVVEAGYFFVPAATRDGNWKDWTVQWNPDRQAALFRPRRVALPSAALGVRWIPRWTGRRLVVLIDTGDARAGVQIGFSEDRRPREEAGFDNHGHGTTVGSLIRHLSADAEVRCYRVFQRSEIRAPSSVVINAISVAVNSNAVHVVCVPLRAEIAHRDEGARGGLDLVLWQRTDEGQRTPVVVCAAGNSGPLPMSYPATVSGVIVSIGVDWSGDPADYNCPPPPGLSPHMIEAFGGVSNDPIGVLRRPGHPERVIYGSSYATAQIAGAIARTADR
ncbi:S8/S53 family peptidase [Acrocarpospora macrocephala]|uniref:S8/S53 family peptidase n=1 Tax=Acrocarpospora macrocephala TaxID=150177 RepID=UPI0012D3503E|nr:S8/S53 family peptidase [Acrocarpospora macrocephala]